MRKTERPATRRHVLIADEDWEFLSRVYGPGGVKSSVGISGAIRAIIGAKCKQLRDLYDQVNDQPPAGKGDYQ